MAIVNQVQKKIRMDQWDIIKFQLLTHCYVNRIKVSEQDLSCLALLSMTHEMTLTDFCNLAIRNEIFGSQQSVRNALAKAEKKQLIVKSGKNKKKIFINPKMNVQTEGNILLDFKLFYFEPVKSEVSIA